MKKTLSFIISAALLFNFIGVSEASFTDVPSDHPYFSDIEYLQEQGVIRSDNFQPDDRITREIFAKWILKNSGFSDDNYQPRTRRRFQDVPFRDNPNAPYVYKLVDLGIIDFSEGRLFYPAQPITRKEALAWIFAVEGIPVPKIFDETNYQASDVPVNSNIAPLIYKAMRIGILQPGRVQPNRKLSRAETAHFLKVAKNSEPTLTVTIIPFNNEPAITQNARFELLSHVWDSLFQTYLRRSDLNGDRLLYGAIEGMAREVGDKHTGFDRPGDSTILDSLSGEIEGIGAVLQTQDDEIIIVAPIVGSPAERAGLIGGDIITAVDDNSIAGLRLEEVVLRIKGRRGTQVKLTIRRGTQILNLTITRDIIRIVSATARRTDDNIAVITLANFGENSTREFQNITDGFTANRPSGIILDMRNNPGGYLDTAVQIAGSFLRQGEKIVGVRYPDREENMESPGPGTLTSYDIIVLVNSGTASAGEILAGALQDYGLARIVGERTYGKGTVQELSNFSDGSSLRITVAEWLTPRGRLIDNNGINPDIVVPMTQEDRLAGRDPQMERALAELRR